MKLIEYTERRDGNTLSIRARTVLSSRGVAWLTVATGGDLALVYDGIAAKCGITEPGRVGFLNDLNVEKDARRRGVGRELVSRLRAFAAKEGVQVIYALALDLEGDNPLPFYLKCGFERVGDDGAGNPYLKIEALSADI